MVVCTARRLPNSKWRTGACSSVGGGGASGKAVAAVLVEMAKVKLSLSRQDCLLIQGVSRRWVVVHLPMALSEIEF